MPSGLLKLNLRSSPVQSQERESQQHLQAGNAGILIIKQAP